MNQENYINSDITIEDIFRVEQEYILYLEGYNVKEIAELVERNCTDIDYDLFVLLKKIDSKKAEEIKKINKNCELFSEKDKWLNLKLDSYHLLLMRGYTEEQIIYLMGINDSMQSTFTEEKKKIKSKKI